MTRLDEIDAAKGGDFTVLRDGCRDTYPGPETLHWQTLLACLESHTLPGGWLHQDATLRQCRAIFDAWQRHHDLPEFGQAHRLAYLVDHYYDDLRFDLQARLGLDLAEEWRARRWRRLASFADRLPRNTYFQAAVANDPEYAEEVAKAVAGRPTDDSKDDPGPSVLDWSPEVAAITQLIDKVDTLIYITRAVGGDKNAPKPVPAPRPTTALEAAIKRMKFSARQQRHEALAMRVLPKKRRASSPVG